MFKIKLFIITISKKMWVKVTLFAILAVFTALGALVFRHYVPDTYVTDKIDDTTILSILTILASSMLAVTTFSLSTMLSAYSSASSNATPRATQLVMEDATTQNVLATFLGTFIFSLSGIIALNLGIYHGNGRVLLFIMTQIVILLIIITLIRWIDHLTKLGRLGITTKMVEEVGAKAMRARAEEPFLGCNAYRNLSPDVMYLMQSVGCNQYGYVQDVDLKKLSNFADKHFVNIFLEVLPGSYVNPLTPLVRLTPGQIGAEEEKAINAAFVIGDGRDYNHDPRFALCVMAEIADRALPPIVNDGGTVIDVVGRIVKLLAIYGDRKHDPEVKYPRLWAKELNIEDMFNDGFNPIARDGAGVFEVQAKLQKAFQALFNINDTEYKDNALRCSLVALKRAQKAEMLPEEIQQLRAIAVAGQSAVDD